MTQHRIANHRIDSMVESLVPFDNYNQTIVAWQDETGRYNIRHWSTLIVSLSPSRGIVSLRHDYISQTTSTLLGRILRAVPRQSVIDYISDADLTPAEAKRILRLAHLK